MTLKRALTIRPSNLDRIMRCPGAGWACKDIPVEENEFMRRGKKLHELAALWYDVGQKAWPQIVKEIRDGIASKLLHEDEMEAFKDVLTQARQLEPSAPHKTLTEHKELLNMFDLDSGTPDIMFIQEDKPWAVVIDWKFGSKPVPPVRENWQMKTYSCAIAVNHSLDVVEPYVLQPKSWDGKKVKGEYVIDRKEMDTLIPAIKAGVKAARELDAPRKAGAHCRETFCPFRDKGCPEYAAMGQAKETEKRVERNLSVKVGDAVVINPPADFALPVVVISQQAIARALYLQEQAHGLMVDRPENAQAASTLLKDISKFKNEIETTRKDIAEKYRKFLGDLKATSDQAVIPLDEAAIKLKADLDKWVAAEDERNAKAEAEAQRIEEEKQEAIRKAEADKRAQEEAERKAANAKTAAQKAKADEAARLAKEKADASAKEAADKVTVVAPPPVPAAPLQGVKKTKVPKWEVLDFSKLPDQFKMVDEGSILAAMKSGKLDEKGLPGVLKCWYETKTSTTGK
jgi:hypothetical protein